MSVDLNKWLARSALYVPGDAEDKLDREIGECQGVFWVASSEVVEKFGVWDVLGKGEFI